MADRASVSVPGMEPISLHVHARDDRYISENLRRRGVWEPLETRVVLNLLEPGQGFVDLGANLGYYTVLAARRVGPSGRVLACEPDEANVALLCRNVADNGVAPWVELHTCAVSDRSGTSRLFRSADNQGDHRLFDAGDGRVSVNVSITTLDDLLSDRADAFHLVKLDTQGSEALILRGARQTLQAQGHRLIWIVEFWPFGLERSGAGVAELLDAMNALDMNLAILDETQQRAVQTDATELRRLAKEGLHPDGGLFVNLVAIPRSQPSRWTRVLEAPARG